MYLNQVINSSPRALQRKGEDYPETTEQLFAPYLWTINGPRDSSFSVVTDGNTLEAPFSVFTRGAYIGLIWEAQDNYSHAARSYNDYSDFTGVTWVFDVVMSASMPVINEPTRALTITIENDQGVCFVPLDQFADTPDLRTSRITLDFDNMIGTVLFQANNQTISPANIKKIMIGLVSNSYINNDPTPLSAREDCLFTLTHVSVTNPIPFTRKNLTLPTQDVGISTSYDDMHNQSPERVINQIKALGYGGKINHYCGMSRYPNREINAALGRAIITETLGNTIIDSAKRWHASFAELLVVEGWECNWAISYEMFSTFANTNYAQRDDDGNLGVTGYTPPSYLLSPVIEAADVPAIAGHTQVGSMVYLGNVFEDFGNIMLTAGLKPILQVGEPWWWWNSDGAPCYYGAVARQKYFDETGDFAPRIMDINDLTGIDINDNGPYTGAQSAQQNFIKWCRDKLGDSTLYLRDRIRAVDATAEATLLFFLPSILNPDVGMVNIVNYPIADYQSPNWDFFMTEAYDWVIKGEGSKAERAITLSTDELGYSAANTEILVGFVPDETLAAAFRWTLLDDVQYKRELWARLFGSIEKNRAASVGRQYIWAYPQVMRDNILLEPNKLPTGLERQDIRRIESDYPPVFVDFDPSVAPPTIPTDPAPDPDFFDATFKQHIIGDSFVTANFADLLANNLGTATPLITTDGVSSTTLTQQAERLANTPDFQNNNLVIMDGQLEQSSAAAIQAIDSMVRSLTHNRWVYVEPSPGDLVDGTPDRDNHDAIVNAIKTHIGNDRFVECLPQLQALNDGSPEDLQDVSDNLVPRSLRTNEINENSSGENARTQIIATAINNKQWHYQPPKSWACHFIGDSMIDSAYAFGNTKVYAEHVFGNRFTSISIDGVGATSYQQQAIRFASTPQHYDKTLIIWDAGSDEFANEAITAIEDMTSRLSHNRWVFVQWNPSIYKLGTTERAFLDDQNNQLRTHFGDQHYVEMLPGLQSKNDGSVQDAQDIIEGLIPRSLRSDFIHYNERGHYVAFNIVANRIRELDY